MKLLFQRVARAAVHVGGRPVAAIGSGALVLAAVERGDGEPEALTAARRLAGLRAFADAAGRMNLDVVASGGAVLLVPQFTLAATLHRGRRPSFEAAAPKEAAQPILARLAAELTGLGVSVKEGVFGANMQVELVNDGPVTFLLEVGGPGSGPVDRA